MVLHGFYYYYYYKCQDFGDANHKKLRRHLRYMLRGHFLDTCIKIEIYNFRNLEFKTPKLAVRYVRFCVKCY